MLLLIQYTLIFSSVLVLVALGGCISEHSGVINLGLEGIMVIGALGGALMMRFPALAALNLPGNVYNMMPYIVSLIVLAFTSKTSRAPKAEGIPYDKGSR